MGMAASQARLLTITARIHDIEYKAQCLQNAKILLSQLEDEAYQKFLRAQEGSLLIKIKGENDQANNIQGLSQLNKTYGVGLRNTSNRALIVEPAFLSAYQRVNGGLVADPTTSNYDEFVWLYSTGSSEIPTAPESQSEFAKTLDTTPEAIAKWANSEKGANIEIVPYPGEDPTIKEYGEYVTPERNEEEKNIPNELSRLKSVLGESYYNNALKEMDQSGTRIYETCGSKYYEELAKAYKIEKSYQSRCELDKKDYDDKVNKFHNESEEYKTWNEKNKKYLNFFNQVSRYTNSYIEAQYNQRTDVQLYDTYLKVNSASNGIWMSLYQAISNNIQQNKDVTAQNLSANQMADMISSGGGYALTQMSGNQYIEGSKYSEDGEIYYDKANPFNYSIETETNKEAVAKASAEYENQLRKVDRKDKMYDTELAKLESERNALTTEYDSLKKVIEDNIERTFGIFS